MRISIIYTSNGPLKAYIDASKALQEHKRLNDEECDEFLYYSVIEMPVEDPPGSGVIWEADPVKYAPA